MVDVISSFANSAYLLKKENRLSARLWLNAGPAGVIVQGVEITEKAALPYPIRYVLLKIQSWDENILCGIFQSWLENRVLREGVPAFDEMILRHLGLPSGAYGRMYGYEHIAALLAGYVSYFDDYSITPEYPKRLFWGFEDPYLNKLFTLVPYENWAAELKIRIKENDFTEEQRWNHSCTLDFSVPSATESHIIQDEAGKTLLLQQIIYGEKRLKVAKMLAGFIPEICEIGDIIKSKNELVEACVRFNYEAAAANNIYWLVEILDTDEINEIVKNWLNSKRIPAGTAEQMTSLLMQECLVGQNEEGKLAFAFK